MEVEVEVEAATACTQRTVGFYYYFCGGRGVAVRGTGDGRTVERTTDRPDGAPETVPGLTRDLETITGQTRRPGDQTHVINFVSFSLLLSILASTWDFSNKQNI